MSPRTVLVVEDNPLARKMLRAALEAEGHTVLEAGGGLQALELQARGTPALVIQDLHLPDLDWLELGRRLKSDESAPAVIAISGLATRLEQARDSDVGFEATLLKPVAPSELLKVVATCLDARNGGTTAEPARSAAVVAVANVALRDRLVATLHARKFEVRAVSDGVAALEALRAHPPTLLVTSVELPLVGGLSLTLASRDLSGRARPVVLMVADRDWKTGEPELARALGVDELAQGAEEAEAAIEGLLGAPRQPSEEPSPIQAMPAEIGALVRLVESQVATIAELERRSENLSAQVAMLATMPAAWAEGLPLELMLDQALRRAFDDPSIEAAAVFLSDAEYGGLSLRAGVGFRGEQELRLATWFRSGERAQVLEQGRTVVIPSSRLPALSAKEDGTYVIAPLKARGNVLGALVLVVKRHGVADESLIAFTQTMAAQIADGIVATRMLETLRRSEERFRLLVESVDDAAIFALTPDGRVMSWNRGAQRLLGYSGEEMIGQRPDKFFTPTDRAMAVVQKRLDLARTHRIDDEGWRVRKDGSWYLAESSVIPLRSEDGAHLGYTVINRDVTARRKAVEVIRALTATLSWDETVERLDPLLVPWMGDVALVHARGFRPHVATGDGATTLNAVPLEAAGTQLLERALERGPELLEDASITDDPRLNVLHDLGLGAYMAVPLKVLEHDVLLAVASLRGRRQFREADLRFLEGVAQPLARALESVELYQRAQHAIRARDDVLAIVAHDLKNPLNALRLWTEALSRRAAKSQDAPTQDVAGQLRQGIDQMTRLITQLLDLGRLEAGAAALERQRVDLRESVHEALGPLRPLASERGLRLEVDACDDPCPAEVDPARFEQVLSNLVGNAIKFTPSGGEVRIQVRPTHGWIVLTVSDTGPGIPSEQLEHLFDRYWQPRGHQRRGSGLGLYIVRQIVEAHGGQVSARSELGHGSTFTATFPRTLDERPTAPAPAPGATP